MQLPTNGQVSGALKPGETPQQEKRGRGRPRKKSTAEASQEESQLSIDNMPLSDFEDKSTVPDSTASFEGSIPEPATGPEKAMVRFDIKDPVGDSPRYGGLDTGVPPEVPRRDAYELLGFHSLEPTNRPPILPRW